MVSATLPPTQKEILADRDFIKLTRDSQSVISRHNWLMFTEQDDFDESFAKLIEVLNTDLDYVKQHTRLLTLASEWQLQSENKSLLLRGQSLQDALDWLNLPDTAQKNELQPSQLHREYIVVSQVNQHRQRRNLGIITLTIFFIIAGLGLGIYLSSQRASSVSSDLDIEEQKSNSLVLAERSDTALSENRIDLALQHALQAYDSYPTFEASSSLYAALTHPAMRYLESYLSRENRRVLALAYSPAGNQVITGGDDDIIYVHDVNSRQLLSNTETYSGDIYTIEFSPEGNIFAIGGNGNGVEIRDARTLELIIAPLQTSAQTIYSLDFSNDGQRLLLAGDANTLQVWSTTDWQLIQEIASPINSLTSTINPDATLIVNAGEGENAYVWNLETGEQVAMLEMPGATWITALAFNQNGSRLFTADSNGVVRIWDTVIWRMASQAIENVHSDWIRSIAFSPLDSSLMLTSGDNGTLTLWDFAGGFTESLTFHTAAVRDVAFAPDSLHALSADADGQVILWDFSSSETLNQSILTHYENPNVPFLASTAHTIVSADFSRASGSQIHITNRESKRTNIITVESPITALDSSDTIIATLDLDRNLTIYDETGAIITSLPRIHDVLAQAIRIHPDEAYIATADEAGNVFLWFYGNEELSLSASHHSHNNSVTALDFASNEMQLASVDRDGKLVIWDLDDTLSEWQVSEGQVLTDVVFTHQGDRLLTSDRQGMLYVLNREGDILFQGQGSATNSYLTDIAVNDNDTWFASTSTDGTVFLWSLDNYQKLGDPLWQNDDWMLALHFLEDDRLLASGHSSNVLSWDTNIARWIESACRAINPLLVNANTDNEAIQCTESNN